jgi:hypothetical protein
MTETLLTPSSIKLYGRLLNDLQYNYDATTVTIGDNNFLQKQLFSAFGGAAAPVTCFARIYAFSFEGAIYSLPKPSIFIVHGKGNQIDFGNKLRTTTDMSGVVAREWEFSYGKDLVYWEYEKGDFSLRLDTEAGPLEQILLAAAVRGADMGDRSGANLGIRSGANVSGANVSGANVSGANISGANVSGANVRNR